MWHHKDMSYSAVAYESLLFPLYFLFVACAALNVVSLVSGRQFSHSVITSSLT